MAVIYRDGAKETTACLFNPFTPGLLKWTHQALNLGHSIDQKRGVSQKTQADWQVAVSQTAVCVCPSSLQQQFNSFIPRILKWTHQALNLGHSLHQKMGVLQKTQAEWQTA